MRRPLLLAGGAAALITCLALVGPWIAPHSVAVDTLADRLPEGLQAPSWSHPLGTDLHGNDVLSLVLCGTRTSLTLGIAASVTTLVLGLLVGASAGYFGGLYDALWMRFVDVVLAFPALLLLILIAAALGPGLGTLFVALSAVGWAGTARVVRSAVLALRNEDFILAARAAGAGPGRILWRHVLPNCLPVVLVLFSLRIGVSILAVADLTFLGLGDPSSVTWGAMVYDGLNYVSVAPWWPLAPASAIALAVLAFNLLGDELRDVLDPRMRDLL